MSNKYPNVVYIVLDDLGFAQLGCYGSTLNTPNIDRLAGRGLRYNNFHTTAICSATRASLLTGANHHTVGVSTVTDVLGGDHPNRMGYTDPHYANVAEVLHEYGYTNFAVGKWHLTPFSDITDAGPFTHWPLHRGFDKFYGFMEGYTDQYHPDLVRDNTRVEPPQTPENGYHLTEDLIDNAIRYVHGHMMVNNDKPYFLYLAPGAMHSPHQAPPEYIDKYKGCFHEGWDELRHKWFDRQKKLGIIPDNAKLNERNCYVKPWIELSDKEQAVYEKYMEVFAGFLEHTDEQLGRFIDYLEESGQLEDTIIVLMSDNGASAEGGREGLWNQDKLASFTSQDQDVDEAYKHLDVMGTEYSNMNYPIGWANLGNTPFQWYKQFVHAGGVKDPLIISYPKQISDNGGIRGQFHHVTDITPTVLDMIGVSKPDSIKGVSQNKYHGVSMKYTFDSAANEGRKHIQYFEMMGNRGLWYDGWKLVCNHMFKHDYDSDEWEIYHVDEDYSEAHNLADKYPDMVSKLVKLWYTEAGKYGVFPLMDGTSLSGDKWLRERMKLNKSFMKPMRFEYNNVRYPIDVPVKTMFKQRNHNIHIEFEWNGRSEGVLYAAGHRFGGYVIYVKDGQIVYGYNYHCEEYTYLRIPANIGNNIIDMNFKMTGEQEAEVTLSGQNVQDKAVIRKFVAMMECRAGIKNGVTSEITPEYKLPYIYPERINHLLLQAEEVEADTKEIFDRFSEID